jgi:transglutaminase-like putative cysteine protease
MSPESPALPSNATRSLPWGSRMFHRVRGSAWLAVLWSLAAAAAAEPALSDVVQLPRPRGPEYFGLYLKGQKVGYMVSELILSPGKETLTSKNQIRVRAKVQAAVTERELNETKVFESKPRGRLLSFVMEQKGDGGEQTLAGTAVLEGMLVVRKRPQRPDETLMLKASKETVEDADQARLALKRGAKVEGMVTDTTDLEQYRVVTTVGGPPEVRSIGGVKVKVRRVESLSDKEKVPTSIWIDDAGRIVEMHFGPTMTAVAEPSDVAQRIDVIELFPLTRVQLPKALPPEARQVPGKLVMVMADLPEKFQVDSYRQSFQRRPGSQVEVTISVRAPKVKRPRPLADPNGGENLKTSIVIESDAPEIKKLAKDIAGSEKDAWEVAKKVSRWVYENMAKDYGASSDRATDALRELKGDCTEHSLLTVSLLRALGIPAKRIDGVVYLMNEDQVPALYWHEWVEAYVGEWTQLDPTFGQDVADATHFAVGQEARAEITPLIGSMRVTEVR